VLQEEAGLDALQLEQEQLSPLPPGHVDAGVEEPVGPSRDPVEDRPGEAGVLLPDQVGHHLLPVAEGEVGGGWRPGAQHPGLRIAWLISPPMT
jgi:hypothetical protein